MFSKELGCFYIECAPRISIKGQVITNFLVELHVDGTAYHTPHNLVNDLTTQTCS